MWASEWIVGVNSVSVSGVWMSVSSVSAVTAHSLWSSIAGYYGSKCEFDNPCECVNNGTCTGGVCECRSGFTGDKCAQLDHCAASPLPCQNGGACSNGQDGAVCICAAGVCVCVRARVGMMCHGRARVCWEYICVQPWSVGTIVVG